MSIMELTSLPIPLSHEAFEYAAQFAARQSTPGKGKRVYLNTLAVYAVHTYLKWIGVETNLSHGDCWQAELQAVLDVADLDVPGVGQIECRPVLPGETSFTVPMEATFNRIGYVAVQFHEQLESVELVGFVRASADEGEAFEPPAIPLSSVSPLDALLEALQPLTPLREFLESIYNISSDWQIMSSVRGESKAISKKINKQFNGYTLGLQVRLKPIENQSLFIQARLTLVDASSDACLPPGIRFLVLDENNQISMQKESQKNISWLQHDFEASLNTRFSLSVVLNDICVTEVFQA